MKPARDFRPKMELWQSARSGPVSRPKAIVFVHGILSSADECFATWKRQFKAGKELSEFSLWGFTYDFHQELGESADQLAHWLKERVAVPDISIVGHSMGGLVGRLAIMRHDLPAVRRLILLATPNSGALTSNQLTALGQLTLLSANHLVSALFNRKPGILSLTNVPAIFTEASGEEAVRRAEGVDYFSVPATYFHKYRQSFTLAGASLLAEHLCARAMQIHLDRPHDGIVTEASNKLTIPEAGNWHEKAKSVQPQFGGPRTYLHVRPRSSDECNHVSIHENDGIAALICRMVKTVNLKSFVASADPTRVVVSYGDT